MLDCVVRGLSGAGLGKGKGGDIPDLVEVLPKLHLGRVRAELLEVGAEEGLAVQDLRRHLVWLRVHGLFEGGTPCVKSARCDVILEELAVDDVDDCRDEGLDVFGA